MTKKVISITQTQSKGMSSFGLAKKLLQENRIEKLVQQKDKLDDDINNIENEGKMNDGQRIILDYCVGDIELIVIINFFLNNQKGSFYITLPGKTG